MDSFTISQVAEYSGIKPHTLRIWEKRYNAVEPNRSEGNTRYYSNSQLRRILNIASLKETGWKVSELCAMTDKELFRLVEEQEKGLLDEPENYFVSQLVSAGMGYDEVHFDKIFSHCVLRYGFRETYTKVIYPMLVRLGLMWTSNQLPPAHEHFISNIVRRKLFTAIDSLPPAKNASDGWLLFLPENEFHELGLLFAHYLIRHSGKEVNYLGSNVPLRSLEKAVQNTKPAHLLLFFVHNNLPENFETYLDELRNRFHNQTIHVAAKRELVDQLKSLKEIDWLNSVDDLERLL